MCSVVSEGFVGGVSFVVGGGFVGSVGFVVGGGFVGSMGFVVGIVWYLLPVRVITCNLKLRS